MTEDDQVVGQYNTTDSSRSKPLAHPRFSLYADRIKTFSSWPTDLNQQPHDLVAAGFFYQGTADIVTCYSCGGSLKEWEPVDDPMIEHAHWFPSCQFLLQLKGEHFIMQAQLPGQREESPACIEKNVRYNMADSVATNLQTRTQTPHSQNVTSGENMEQLLNTPAALSVLMMGYDRDTVIGAIKRCLKSGQTLPSATDIMKVLLDMEDENENENNSETEIVFNETNNEDTMKSESENEVMKNESENEVVKGENERVDMSQFRNEPRYSQCTEGPSSGPNTTYNTTSPFSTYASQPVSDKCLPAQTKSTPQTLSSELNQMNDLVEENRMLKENGLCKICMDKNSNTVFLPCGHLATCAECASSLRTCPLCRMHIHGTVKVYLA
ncbi:baculoviral IAP repeat-containing protein 3-like [Ylistrum balloti]|uniref:baculoviral IAP repeat-containing protein 3-like n=1 Tax=Ylistrum balloti TaxID=509963 RepID=UPI0029059760|nr:baculoviral IAP repeat-containing protein 3-like [Ylistrum balloti]